MESGLQFVQVDLLCPVPTPQVTYYGAAANAGGRQVANIVEFLASERYYLAVVEIPEIQHFDDRVNLTINNENKAKIEGEIDLAEMLTDMPLGRQTWGISFDFPGPVDWWTAFVLFTSETMMEISVMKTRPVAELATATAADVAAFLDTWLPPPPASPLAVASPAAASSSTGSGSTEAVASQEGASLPFPELDDMISEWFA